MARVGFEPRPCGHEYGALITRPRCRQLLCLSKLLLPSIPVSLGRFCFEIMLLEVTFIHLFAYLSSNLQDNVEGEKLRATIRRLPGPAIEMLKYYSLIKIFI